MAGAQLRGERRPHSRDRRSEEGCNGGTGGHTVHRRPPPPPPHFLPQHVPPTPNALAPPSPCPCASPCPLSLSTGFTHHSSSSSLPPSLRPYPTAITEAHCNRKGPIQCSSVLDPNPRPRQGGRRVQMSLLGLFFKTRMFFVKDSPQGLPTANRQPPTAANRQPLLNTVSVGLCLAHVLTMKQRASP